MLYALLGSGISTANPRLVLSSPFNPSVWRPRLHVVASYIFCLGPVPTRCEIVRRFGHPPFFCFFFHSHLLSSFWTSRGHRCRPFSPRFLPSIFIAQRVQQSHCSLISHRVLRTHALALSASQICAQKKVPTNLYE